MKITVAANKRAMLSGNGVGKVKLTKKAKQVSVRVRPGAGKLRIPLTLTAGGERRAKTLSIPRSATTAYQAALSGVDAKGRVTKQMALQAFSLAVGPLPDVELPTGKVGPVTDATGPIHWIQAVRKQLSPVQRKEVDRLLRPLRTRSSRARAGAAPPPELQRNLDRIRLQLALHLGPPAVRGTSSPMQISLVTGGLGKDYRAFARADAYLDAQGRVDECEIVVGPRGLALGGAEQTLTLAHELFHCYQYQVVDNPRDEQPWIADGGAEWVGAEIAQELHGPFAETFWWPRALNTPNVPLQQRSYDAAHWFAQLVMSGINPFPRLLPALVATRGGDFLSGYGTMTGGNDFFLNGLWASSYFTDPALGPEWNLIGPGRGAATSHAITRHRLEPGKPVPFESKAFATGQAFISSTTDDIDVWVLENRTGQDVRFNDRRANFGAPKGEHAYCVEENRCANLPQDCKKPPPNTQLDSVVGVHVAYGGRNPANLSITGKSLDEYCANKAFLPGGACWTFPPREVFAHTPGTPGNAFGASVPPTGQILEISGCSYPYTLEEGGVTITRTANSTILDYGSEKVGRGAAKTLRKSRGVVKGLCDAAAVEEGTLICVVGRYGLGIGDSRVGNGRVWIDVMRRAAKRFRAP